MPGESGRPQGSLGKELAEGKARQRPSYRLTEKESTGQLVVLEMCLCYRSPQEGFAASSQKYLPLFFCTSA